MPLTGEQYKFKTNGPYCYRISGQVYHVISQMHPESMTRPSFFQIYTYDQQNELENRLKACQGLDPTVLQELQEMLKQVNPYAQIYLQAGDIMKEKPTEDIKLVLRTTGIEVGLLQVQLASRNRCSCDNSIRWARKHLR